MEARSYFSLFCINEETQLVHAYMELMATTLQSLVLVEMQGHKDVSNDSRVWTLDNGQEDENIVAISGNIVVSMIDIDRLPLIDNTGV